MDIRRYFGGLIIPDGGVHIVGGDKGDAFIAFATDEDARQAMERDNGKIKDVRIKLLLSSRNEMQRIIDVARNQTIAAAHQGISPSSNSQQSKGGQSSKSRRSRSPDKKRSRSPDRRRDRDRDRDKSSKKSSKRRSRSRSPKRKERDNNRRRDRSTDRSKDSKPEVNTEEKGIHPPPKEENSRMSLDSNNMDIQENSVSQITPQLLPQQLAPNQHPPQQLLPNQHLPQQLGPQQLVSQQFPNQQLGAIMNPSEMSMLGQPNPNLGFGPLFPIVKQDNIPNQNMNMLDQPFPGRLQFDNMQPLLPLSDARDSFEKRDPPVWQNTQTLPFGLLQMGPGPMGNVGVESIVDRNLIPNNNNMPNMSNMLNMSNMPTPNRMGGMDRMNMLPDMQQRDDKPILDSMPHGRMMSNESEMFDHGRGFSRRNGGRDSDMNSGPMPSKRSSPPRRNQRLRGYCVEMRNLPFAITYREVREFLKGCHMTNDGLALVEVDGHRTGEGYALFCGEKDVQEALRRNKSLLLNRRVEMSRCDESEFFTAMESTGSNRSNKSHYKQQADDLVVILKGIPFASTEKDIVTFLNGLEISDVVVQYDEKGKTVGTGYVRFSHYNDYKIALTYDGRKLLHRYVEVLPSTIQDMYEASKFSPAPPTKPLFHKMDPRMNEEMNQNRTNNMTFVVSIRGLPPNVIDKDIADFFAQENINPQAIHIMVNPNGLPSGDAFVEFINMMDFETALKRNGEVIADRSIRINPITFDKMNEILGRPAMRNQEQPRPPLIGPGPTHLMDSDFDRGMDDKPMGNLPYMDEMENAGNRFQGGPPGPGFGRPRGPGGMGPMGGGPPFQMMGPRYPQRSIMRNPVPDSFGKPGCVVAARNISFRASDSDIEQFFASYNINGSNIIRRFDNMGKVTGDARIDFNIPEDANRAIAEFSGKMFMGRNIILSKL